MGWARSCVTYQNPGFNSCRASGTFMQAARQGQPHGRRAHALALCLGGGRLWCRSRGLLLRIVAVPARRLAQGVSTGCVWAGGRWASRDGLAQDAARPPGTPFAQPSPAPLLGPGSQPADAHVPGRNHHLRGRARGGTHLQWGSRSRAAKLAPGRWDRAGASPHPAAALPSKTRPRSAPHVLQLHRQVVQQGGARVVIHAHQQGGVLHDERWAGAGGQQRFRGQGGMGGGWSCV